MSAESSISIHRNSSQNLPIISTLLLLDSFHFVWARLLLSYINPRVSALYVMAIATVVVGVFAFARGQINFGVLRKHLGFFVLIGLLIAISTNLSYIAIGYVDPGAATLLVQLSTPLSILIGVVWLKERFTHWQFVGAMLATLGVCIVALQPSDFFRIGSLLILCGVPLYTFHTALVKRNGDLDFVNFYFFRLLFTTLALFLFSSVQGALEWPTLEAWPLLIATGAIDVAGSRALYYLALRRLNLSAHAVILTISPVITTVWSFSLFGIVPTAQQWVGGIIVMAGVWLATIGWRYFGSKLSKGSEPFES